MRRQPNGHTSINKRADGLYHTDVHIGHYANGRPKRKHIKRRTAVEVAEARDELLKLLKAGRDPGDKMETFGAWTDHWLNVVLKRRVRMKQMAHNTWVDYEKICRVHLVPALGELRITGRKYRLEAAHVEELWASLAEIGREGSYIVKMHTVLRRILKEAYRAGRADRIVTELMDAPTFTAKKVKALPRRDAELVLKAALGDRLAARWALGILQGPRQGEALGIRWPQVILDPEAPDVPHILPERQLQRRTWEHGCDDAVACARPHCRTRPCPPKYSHGCADPAACKTLVRYCPKRTEDRTKCARHTRMTYCRPCPTACTAHASSCPARHGGGLVEGALKTDASEAPMALSDVVVELLRRHRELQIRELAGLDPPREFDPQGYVFLDERGKPIDPRRDWQNWVDLQIRAGIKRPHRLHAARHTTGTFLRATGADLRMVQDVLRQSQLATAGGYVDVALEAQRDAVNAVAALLMEGDLSKILGAKRGVVL